MYLLRSLKAFLVDVLVHAHGAGSSFLGGMLLNLLPHLALACRCCTLFGRFHLVADRLDQSFDSVLGLDQHLLWFDLRQVGQVHLWSGLVVASAMVDTVIIEGVDAMIEFVDGLQIRNGLLGLLVLGWGQCWSQCW